MSKNSTAAKLPQHSVRTRRAYFDFQYGQLHVRTAFPTTGGFDEQVTLICLHPPSASSRVFARFLPAIATDRSAYAPDLPGCGESDAAPTQEPQVAARAVADLAADLRLRQIDVLGFADGCAAAVELALARPELVRRLCLVAMPAVERAALLQQPCLLLRIGARATEPRAGTKLPRDVQVIDAPEYADDLFDAAPQTLAAQVAPFLNRKT